MGSTHEKKAADRDRPPCSGCQHGGDLRASNRTIAGGPAVTAAAERATVPQARPRPRWMAFFDREEGQGLALISPTFLYALVLLAVPILVVLAHSFWTQHYLTIDHTFTLENYRLALFEPIYQDLLVRSLVVSALVSLFTVVLAYPIAYYISFHGGGRKPLWLFLITIPFWTSYLLRVMSWKVILGYGGVLNSGLMGLGIIDEPSTAFLYNTSAVVLTLTHAWAAFAILPIFVSLEKVDRTLIEAATDLGDGPLRALPARHAAAVDARRHLGAAHRDDPDRRRLRDAAAGRRQGRRDDRQRHPGAVRQGRQLAARGGAVGHHHGGRLRHGRGRPCCVLRWAARQAR